jgi:hypothetical protein
MKHAKRKRGDHVGFESSSLSIAITSDNRLANLAEVVGSTPTRSIFSYYRTTASNHARFLIVVDKTR